MKTFLITLCKEIKPLTTFMLCLMFFAVARADEAFEKNKDILDRGLYDAATVVIRVWVKSEGEGSKYYWADVLNHATLKAPEGTKIPEEFKVAYQSIGQGLPTGFATLYLEHYNPEKPEFGWKLVEHYDPKTKKLLKGYSHHSVQTKAEDGVLDVSLEVNEEDGRCVLKITNTSPEPVTILRAFDRGSGMSANLPMGTAYKIGENEEWIYSYRISSQLSDHGPSYTTDEEGNVIEGPKQLLVVLAPKEEISTEFSLEVVIRWMWEYVEKREDGNIRMKDPFYLRAGVFVQKSETEFDFIQASSDEISYPRLFKPQ